MFEGFHSLSIDRGTLSDLTWALERRYGLEGLDVLLRVIVVKVATGVLGTSSVGYLPILRLSIGLTSRDLEALLQYALEGAWGFLVKRRWRR